MSHIISVAFFLWTLTAWTSEAFSSAPSSSLEEQKKMDEELGSLLGEAPESDELPSESDGYYSGFEEDLDLEYGPVEVQEAPSNE